MHRVISNQQKREQIKKALTFVDVLEAQDVVSSHSSPLDMLMDCISSVIFGSSISAINSSSICFPGLGDEKDEIVTVLVSEGHLKETFQTVVILCSRTFSRCSTQRGSR